MGDDVSVVIVKFSHSGHWINSQCVFIQSQHPADITQGNRLDTFILDSNNLGRIQAGRQTNRQCKLNNYYRWCSLLFIFICLRYVQISFSVRIFKGIRMVVCVHVDKITCMESLDCVRPATSEKLLVEAALQTYFRM